MSQKAAIDTNVQAVLDSLTAQKHAAYIDASRCGATAWIRPPLNGWSGDVATTEDLVQLHAVFNTDDAERRLIDTFDPASPGNSGDAIVLTLQIDYMAQAERAYRARHAMSFPRMVCHAAARDAGHGSPTGLFSGQVSNYFSSILAQAAQAEGGSV